MPLPAFLLALPALRATRRGAALALLAAVLVGAAPAVAGVYKCKADGASVIYQEDPCPPGKELRNFDTDPPELSIIPPRIAPPPAPAPRPVAADKPAREARPLDVESVIGKSTGNANNRKFIQKGMNEAEVLAKIGRPDATATGGGKSSHLRWSYLPSPEDPDTVTTITFNGGSVTEITRKVVKR